MSRHVVSKVRDLPPGERMIVSLGGKGGIGIFNIGGRFHALRNRCPHQGGPLCEGRLRPHVISRGIYKSAHEQNRTILKCPWHQWEFDMGSGRALYDEKLRVKTYRVQIENEDVVLYLNL